MTETDPAAHLTEACRNAPPDVVAVYLFGSIARGSGSPKSDMDVAVLLRDEAGGGPSAATEALMDRLERAARRSVDLVVLNGAPPDLIHRVLRDGVLLLDRDRPRRLDFEVQTRNDYFDLEPIRRAYRGHGATGGASSVTDPGLVAKKLAVIETSVADLRRLARPEALAQDVREQRFVEHTLQIAIQASIDIASHIVSDDRLGEPDTNRQLFDLLLRGGWLSAELADTMKRMTGLWNVLVHGYQVVDLAILRDIVEHRLDDLLAFVEAIRRRL